MLSLQGFTEVVTLKLAWRPRKAVCLQRSRCTPFLACWLRLHISLPYRRKPILAGSWKPPTEQETRGTSVFEVGMLSFRTLNPY